VTILLRAAGRVIAATPSRAWTALPSNRSAAAGPSRQLAAG